MNLHLMAVHAQPLAYCVSLRLACPFQFIHPVQIGLVLPIHLFTCHSLFSRFKLFLFIFISFQFHSNLQFNPLNCVNLDELFILTLVFFHNFHLNYFSGCDIAESTLFKSVIQLKISSSFDDNDP